jgi:hypothetical protein
LTTLNAPLDSGLHTATPRSASCLGGTRHRLVRPRPRSFLPHAPLLTSTKSMSSGWHSMPLQNLTSRAEQKRTRALQKQPRTKLQQKKECIRGRCRWTVLQLPMEGREMAWKRSKLVRGELQCNSSVMLALLLCALYFIQHASETHTNKSSVSLTRGQVDKD